MGLDLRQILRGLARSPGFVAVALVTLALGIGANTAIFSVLSAVLLRPLPYPGSAALVEIGQSRTAGQINTVSFLDYTEWRRDARTLASLAAWHDEQLTLTGGERPVRLVGVASSANLFSTLGVRPALGRDFAADEDQRGKNRVVIFTHGAWQRIFGGDPAILDHTVTIDDQPYTVIGILPADFTFPMRDEPRDAFVTMPRPWDEAMLPRRGASYLSLVGRLSPQAQVAAAQADLDAQAARQAREFPDDSANRHVTVRALHEELTAAFRPALLVLFGAVAFVLLIACANVAHLLLARGAARHHEIAIRRALGAGRARVVGHFLVESAILAVAGGGLGVLVALWALDALRAFLPRAALAIRPIAIDGRVLLFTLAAAVVTGAVFGLVPALQASSADPQDALREGGRATAGRSRRRARAVLVALETGVATILLAGAGLMLTSFARLSRVDPGFDPRGVVASNVFLPDGRYGKREASAAFYHALSGELDRLPGARAAAIVFPLPFSHMNLGIGYAVDGEPPPGPGHERAASVHLASPRALETLGIPLRGGRNLAPSDDRVDAAPVVVIGEGMARRLFPGGDAVGKRLTIDWQGPESYAIVGVAGDVRGSGDNGLDVAPVDDVYLAFGRTPFPFVTFAARGDVTVDLLADAVRRVDAALPIGAVHQMADQIGDSMARQRLAALLLAIFGGLALVLALVGVYGVIAYTTTQRRHEIGIRVALGARGGEVVRMLVVEGMRVALVGVALGLVAALALGGGVAKLLYGVAPQDPLVLSGACAVLLLTATIAAWLPARRAARVHPMDALRV